MEYSSHSRQKTVKEADQQFVCTKPAVDDHRSVLVPHTGFSYSYSNLSDSRGVSPMRNRLFYHASLPRHLSYQQPTQSKRSMEDAEIWFYVNWNDYVDFGRFGKERSISTLVYIV